MKVIIEKKEENKTLETYIAFISLTKTFDRDRKKLWKIQSLY